ncbi:MAG TPA: hypothetical protein VJN29_11805 [Intrasporangium sp.]|uniref:glycoside hydrolase family 113 n=1 Tax=Intrasporangium sp. TaxID=1925024 RepID=UPI002B486924|nr:hypothetical protein [Intrasporangium sp.]HKX67901.1 hypothetical protein [Intrasporangium sp.]
MPAAKRWQPGDEQRGLQVYAHNANGKSADANIGSILDYVVDRGANSVAYSFPIYTDGQRPKRVYTSAETPEPEVLGKLVAAAKERGLRVMVRPLIDEANLRTPSGGWRGTIQPPDLKGWFESYEDALMPYLKSARAAKADEFVLATELTSLQPEHDRWEDLARSAAKVFPSTLSYTFNWDAADEEIVPRDGAAGLDLYFAVDLGPDATVEELTDALSGYIMAKPKSLRSNMVAQEVGIAAEDDAYQHPWNWGSSDVENLSPKIQVNWFTAACQAVREAGLKGIYYWMLDSSIDPAKVDPRTEGSAGFIGRPGEKAIERCFAGK